MPEHAAATLATAPTLVVIDQRLANANQLAAEAGKDARVVLVGQTDDGLAVIEKALEEAGKVSSLQIYSHGAAGQFALGSRTLSADNVVAAGSELQTWSSHFTPDGDILLLGCNVGAGQSGQTLVSALAQFTGADVAASTNDTGPASAGGDWVLELSTGNIESHVPALAYEGLLADANPTLALSTSSTEALLGSQFSFAATFTNTAGQVGFAPFIDLVLPATGKDGAGSATDDGVEFVSATYLGQAVKSYVLTFDANGDATHPLAKDSSGNALVVHAAAFGAQAGDQLVVLSLPYASVSSGQPGIPVLVTCRLSDLADTQGSPDLTIKTRSGFEFGNDSADNPTADPSLIETGTHDLVVHPTMLTLSQTLSMPEGETATGPNFEHSVTVTATPAPGQTLTDLDVTQTLSGSIRVTSISPGSGGSVTSITLADGSVLNTPATIAAALQLNPYLSSYTVHYASLSSPSNTVVSFYVPYVDYAGNAIIDPFSGDAQTISLGSPTATASWLPLDTRDRTEVTPPTTPPSYLPASVSASGSPASFVARSVALHKSEAIASDTGSGGLSPGDTLQYTLEVSLSDFFAMGATLGGVGGGLTVTDTLGDGQRLVSGSAIMTLYSAGTTTVVPLVFSEGAPGTGGTLLTIDLAQSLTNSGQFIGALLGDLVADGLLQAGTRAVISYRTVVDQAYTTTYPQSEINEGDSIANNAVVTGTILLDPISFAGTESDSSSASLTVPTHTISTSILSVNGAAPGSNVELKPGDLVTFKLAYNLQTSDYENLKLVGYLPLPLFDLSGLPLTQGSGIGQWSFGSGNTNADSSVAVTVGSGNSLVFDFGSFASANVSGSRIEVQFTLQVGNQPFADQRSLTVLGQSDQTATVAGNHLISSGVVNIASVAEPVLAIKHGVVSVGAGSAGVVAGTTGTWAAAGSAGVPFVGSLTDLVAVEGDVTGIDAGDLVRLATAIENTGGLGAYDVVTSISLPTGLAFVGGSLGAANLTIYRGDGTALVAGVDYNVSGNSITFLDAGGSPSLLPGRAGTANEASGANLLIIAYDTVASGSVAAGQSLQSTASLNNYSGTNGGPDFTPVDLTDTALQSIATPTIVKLFADGSLTADDSSASHTTGANLVVGESVLYDIVVTLPEGVTQSLRLNDLIPAGLSLDTSFAGAGYQVITSAAGSGALSADFAGAVSVGSASAAGGDGSDLNLSFSAATVSGDNNVGNNSFVVRVRLIASNVAANQAGSSRANDGNLLFSDPDGDTPVTGTPLDRTVALASAAPTITVCEPTLVISQTASHSGASIGVDRDALVTYTISLSNRSGNNDFNAYDITLSDTLPSQLDYLGSGLGLLSVTYAGGATANSGPDFVISGGMLQTAGGANVDIPKGGSITLVVVGKANTSVGSVGSVSNTASVRWTSLDGTSPLERSGVDGSLNSGVLNDYRVSSTATVPVAAGATLSHVGGLADTPAPTPTTSQAETVAVGEIVHYRVAVIIPQGTVPNADVVINLPNGLSFINDGSASIGFVSNGGLTSSLGGALVTAGSIAVAGGVSDLSQTLLAADLSNSVSATLNTAQINTADPRAVVVSLGTLNNTDADLDSEVIYLEFNARVDNSTAVDTSKSLAANAVFRVNASVQSTTPSVIENVVEPNLGNLQKTISDFDPRTASATGLATLTLSFSNAGDGIAYDARLTDSVTGGSNYTLSAVVINGTSYLPGSLPAGVSVSTTGGISADFASVAVGASIRLVYTVEVPNGAAIPSSNASLDWSSLPESFSAYAGSAVGTDASISGERDGSGGATPPNTYMVGEGAGLGIISGRLWDDTASATASTTPDGAGLAGQTVTLTWAGADGNLSTTADNRTYTAITDANGDYHFGVLPSGSFRITTPNPVTAYVFGADTDNLAARIDSDGGTLASVTVSSLGEGASVTANVGYVRENDAPVNTLPGIQTTDEDTSLAIAGIAIADVDAGTSDLTVSLSVLHGTLNLATAGVTVTAGANNSASLTIRGSQTSLNAALATLQYAPLANWNGTDTLTVVSNDLGNTGDFNGNGLPDEAGDARSDTDRLSIVVNPINDPPQGVADLEVAIEAGGKLNDVPGLNAAFNVLTNDTDVDIQTNADRLAVSFIRPGISGTDQAVTTAAATPVVGNFGTLTIDSGGNGVYIVDNDNASVQALRRTSDTLNETFTYTVTDLAGLTSTALITVRIQGANDAPIGIDDTGTALEAGGIANGSPSPVSLTNASGNVLGNDTDIDLFGETMVVTGIRTGLELLQYAMTGVPASGTTSVSGTYGILTIDAGGNYTYVVDQANATVQAMVAGDTLSEYFSYVVSDAGGLSDIAQISITIQGADDAPVAVDDVAVGQAAQVTAGTVTGTPNNPLGNVLVTPPGEDTDEDRLATLGVTGIRTGSEIAGGTMTAVAANSTAASGYTDISSANGYGTLRIGADGSFQFLIDSTNAAIQALSTGQSVLDHFTYRVSDSSGLTDTAELTVTIYGVNNPPVAQDVFSVAIERGGVANGTVGLDPTGDALANDFDPEGNALVVSAIRTGSEAAGTGTVGLVGSALRGTYGWLTLQANGTYSYQVDNDMAAVQALRTSADRLTDTFTYTEVDNGLPPAGDQAQIVIQIRGRNDNPVATDDVATAVEAGGIANNIVGTDPQGNVLSNDADVDAVVNGETKAVSAVRTGAESGSGSAGSLGQDLQGSYGWLRLNADGSYTYRVDNSLAAVQALRSNSDTLTDQFTYTLADTALAMDQAQLTITIRGRNDNPVAAADAATATEAGGLANAVPGSNASGNVLGNDSDVDSLANGETKTVVAIENSSSTLGSIGGGLAGDFGSLTLNADGSFTYVVDNGNSSVQALRSSSDTLSESFTYTVADAGGATSTALLTITIQGANDNPVAVNDRGTAVEAGGVANGTPGSDATGNVLNNDSDVDTHGETKVVSAVGAGSTAGVVGTAVAGQYGSVTINADGGYTYVVDNANASVQALRLSRHTLTDSFTYQVSDRLGATSTASLTITLRGANDAPVAIDDGAIAAPSTSVSAGFDPSGNVLTNDTDVDSTDSKVVTAIRTGSETGSGTAGNLGDPLVGTYGTLVINADGSYLYTVDAAKTASLRPTDVVSEFFTYQMTDAAGLADSAQLTILVRGRNDPPVAADVLVTAVEAGGVANGTAGINPGGDATGNDFDAEGDVLTVTAIRTGAENSSGVAGNIDTPLQGLYGTLTIHANGAFSYVLDNSLAAVEALRSSGDTLTDTFTCTVADSYMATDQAAIVVTITGSNDTPVAINDTGIAVEAGGVANGIPGSAASGNVLVNDSDVDAYGETKAVSAFSNSASQAGSVGAILAGQYGSLQLNADGSYTYTVDDNNLAVQALRTPAETLSDSFTYVVRDAAGAVATATLTITVKGANDTPTAVDDAALVSDQAGRPVTTGNVLPNDRDVDQGDSKTVAAVRTGPESAAGTSGTIGTALRGNYGTLVLNADGSYRYEVDMSNPAVQQAAGRGRILNDVFTYAMHDTAGSADQAELVISLDIAAPHQDFPAAPFYEREQPRTTRGLRLPDVEPIVYVERVVDYIDRIIKLSDRRTDGAKPGLGTLAETQSVSIGAGLGMERDVFVAPAVRESRSFSRYDASNVEARLGVVSLTADGLFNDLTAFSPVPDKAQGKHVVPAKRSHAPSLSEQLKQSTQGVRPLSKMLKETGQTLPNPPVRPSSRSR